MYCNSVTTRVIGCLYALGLVLFALYLGANLAHAGVVTNLTPNAEGTYLQFAPSTGTTHYTLVDDTTCNGNTDYNATTGVGDRDSYRVNLSSVPNGSTITKIEIAPCASRAARGSTNPVMNVFYRLNGVNSADQGSYSLSSLVPVGLPTTTYSGISVSKSTSTVLEIGAVLTSGTKGVRLSRMSTTVTYQEMVSAPTGLTALASVAQPNISLSWTDTASNETAFVIERKIGAGSYVTLATTSANTTVYTDTAVAAETAYSYRVRALSADGVSTYSNEASATTGTIPASPAGFVAVASPTAVSLSWVDGTTETGYALSRRIAGSGEFQPVVTTPENSITYLDEGLTSGTYEYRIYAENGFGTSAYAYATATLGSAPIAPANFTAVSTTTRLYLSWSAVAGADGYLIERHTGSSSYSFIATTSNTSYYDSTNIVAGEIYYYRISAFNAFGSSPYAFAWIAAGGPSAPTNLTATYVASPTPSVLLGWTDTSNSETGFHIFRSSNGVNYSFLTTRSANVTSYTDTTATTGMWYYRLFAYNASGASVYTNVATVVVP